METLMILSFIVAPLLFFYGACMDWVKPKHIAFSVWLYGRNKHKLHKEGLTFKPPFAKLHQESIEPRTQHYFEFVSEPQEGFMVVVKMSVRFALIADSIEALIKYNKNKSGLEKHVEDYIKEFIDDEIRSKKFVFSSQGKRHGDAENLEKDIKDKLKKYAKDIFGVETILCSVKLDLREDSRSALEKGKQRSFENKAKQEDKKTINKMAEDLKKKHPKLSDKEAIDDALIIMGLTKKDIRDFNVHLKGLEYLNPDIIKALVGAAAIASSQGGAK